MMIVTPPSQLLLIGLTVVYSGIHVYTDESRLYPFRVKILLTGFGAAIGGALGYLATKFPIIAMNVGASIFILTKMNVLH